MAMVCRRRFEVEHGADSGISGYRFMLRANQIAYTIARSRIPLPQCPIFSGGICSLLHCGNPRRDSLVNRRTGQV